MFDICVIGGGMVGSAVALGMGQMGFNVALIEPSMPKVFEPGQATDIRVSAISLTSEKLLQELGGWAFIQNMRLCPYQKLSVWEQPNCRTDFNCESIQQPHLGHIIENRIVQLGLHSAINQQPNIQLFENVSVANIDTDSQISLADGQTIETKIIVGADGGNSLVRSAAKIGVQGWQYSQQALGILVKTNSPQQNITWQQFTPNGPIAFLPLHDGFASLVWYHNIDQIRYLKSLPKHQLKQQIIQYFPAELVDFEVLDFASFPLTRMHANQYAKGNNVLVGDAAHTINPLAGQGVNLGFKDVAALINVVTDELKMYSKAQVLEEARFSVWLKAYEQKRRNDNLRMMTAMDLLNSSFSNNHLPIKLIRNIGLKIANQAGPLKKSAMKYAMGLA